MIAIIVFAMALVALFVLGVAAYDYLKRLSEREE